MQCPTCGNKDAEELADEVDIGVGVQKHVYGCNCPDCGQLACCSTCGYWDGKHSTWCLENYDVPNL
jgi:hypothetical protein